MKIKIAFTTLIAVVVLWSCKTENQDSKDELTQEFANLMVERASLEVLLQRENRRLITAAQSILELIDQELGG